MIKVQSYMMLVLPDVKMEPSNVRKKIRELLNVIKVRPYVMLVLPNVTMEPSNVRKKNIGTVRLNLFNHFVGFINSAFRNPIFRCESCKGSV